MGAKLIRDKVKDDPNISDEARIHIRKASSEDEHFGLLVGKLFEEIGELMAFAGTEGVTNEDLLEEIVDIYTVLTTMIGMNYTSDEFQAAFKKKLEEKGGFAEGWVWDRDRYLGE